MRTLDYYIQEVGAQLFLHQLGPQAKSTIAFLSLHTTPTRKCSQFSLRSMQAVLREWIGRDIWPRSCTTIFHMSLRAIWPGLGNIVATTGQLSQSCEEKWIAEIYIYIYYTYTFTVYIFVHYTVHIYIHLHNMITIYIYIHVYINLTMSQ
jgi:hypothetical protein